MSWGLDIIGAAVGMVGGLQLMILRAMRQRDRREARDRHVREMEEALFGTEKEPDLADLPPFWRKVVRLHRELRRP